MQFSLLIFSIILLVACSETKKQPTAPKQEEVAALEVGVEEVKKKKIALSSELFGRVRSTNVAEIRPQINGIILERLFDEGSYVEKGQQLYLIDPAPYEAAFEMAVGQLKRARATLYSAKTLLDRYQGLIKQNAVSKQELDNAKARHLEAKADISIAQAEVDRAQVNLNYTKVLSPISGFAGKSDLTKGALVTANQALPLTVVRSLDPVYIDLSLPSSEAMQIHKRLGKHVSKNEKGEGLTVSIKLDAINANYTHKGKIEARELSVNEESGSIGLRAVVPNPDLILLPGMFVRAYVDQLGYGEKIIISQKAVQRDKNGDAHVWVVKNDQSVERRRIETGAMYGKDWIIERGLQEDEIIAIDNFSKLSPEVSVSPLAQESK